MFEIRLIIGFGESRSQDMLEAVSLGVAVMLEERTAIDALSSADILLPGILPALDLLLNPLNLL